MPLQMIKLFVNQGLFDLIVKQNTCLMENFKTENVASFFDLSFTTSNYTVMYIIINIISITKLLRESRTGLSS